MKWKDNKTDDQVAEDVLRKYLIRCHSTIGKDYAEVAGMEPAKAADFLIHLRNTGRIRIELFNETPVRIGCRIVELKAEKGKAGLDGQYLSASNEIIGERTFDEKRYDTEVVRWLNKGKLIQKAIAKANEKFPAQALSLNTGNLADIQAHYDYLAKHEAITRKLHNNGAGA